MLKIRFSNSVFIFIYVFLALIGHFIFDNNYSVLIIILSMEVLRQLSNNNLITGYSFWSLGFLLLVCFDGILTKTRAIEEIGIDLYNYTSSLFTVSALIIIITYQYLKKKGSSNTYIYLDKKELSKQKDKDYLNLFIIIFIYILFLFNQLPNAINILIKGTYAAGKESEFGGLNGGNRSIISTLLYFVSHFSGYIIPALIYFWIQKKYRNPNYALLAAIFLSLPIFGTYFLIGIRQNILYSIIVLIGVFSLTKFTKVRFKFKYIIVIYLAILVSNTIKEARQYGYIDYIFNNKTEIAKSKKKRYLNIDKTEKTTLYMGYVVDYYNTNDYRLGKSTSSILLFWVPRKIWKEKPPIFGYWFIREYYADRKLLGFGDKYSAPASYLATPYSDFGYLGVISISLIIAYILNKVDLYFRKNRHTYNYKKMIIMSFCLAGFFFLPRQLNQFFSKTLIVFFFIQLLFIFNKKNKSFE